MANRPPEYTTDYWLKQAEDLLSSSLAATEAMIGEGSPDINRYRNFPTREYDYAIRKARTFCNPQSSDSALVTRLEERFTKEVERPYWRACEAAR